LKGRSDAEFSKEGLFLFQGSLKTKIRNFLGGRVNLSVVISVDFLSKDLLGRFHLGDIFSDTGSNQMVLEPTIRPFHFPFGLGGEGISDFYITIIQNLLPLRSGFVSEEVVFSPDRIPSLNKSEDRMGVHIIGIRESIAKEDGLEGQDMGPAGLFLDQRGIKDQPTIIIQGGDQIPFLLSRGGPKMIRGVMLNEFPDITG
jgi:hypothetical protein